MLTFLKLCTGATIWIDGQSDVQMAGPLDIAAGKQKDPEIRTRISLPGACLRSVRFACT